jgi:hypothetical protein
MSTEYTQPLQDGIDSANAEYAGADSQAYARECADVKQWQKAINDAREFDKNARKRYARDRSYARADRTHFTVDVPIAQSYIDVLRSFLYARDPDVDVTPSGMTEPPPQKAILAMVAKQVEQGQPSAAPELPAMLSRLLGTVGGQGASPALPGGPVPPQAQADMQDKAGELQLQQLVAQKMEPYQRLRDNAKQFADTLALVIPALWKKAKLKAQAKELVGSALTIGPGWLKAVWLERKGQDPEIARQLNDIQDNLARMAALRKELDDGTAPDDDAVKAELERQAQALQAKVEVVVARGFAIDFVPGEDVQVSTDCRDLAAYADASWIAHRVFMPVDQAKQDHPQLTDEQFAKATLYYPMQPRDTEKSGDSGAMATNVDPTDADAYRKGTQGGASIQTGGVGFLCLWEVWDRTSSTVITFFEGMDCYAKPPFPPHPATTRFYPFFQYQIGHVTGERHPRSLITRSERLFDEYNSVRSNFRKHRQRAIPKTAFDATNYDDEQIAKIEGATHVEMVGLKPARPGTPVKDALANIAYPAVDMALYDTGPIRAELEMIWGIQEALSSSIHTAKTLGEAEIQQQGTNARQGYMRDDLDEMFTDMAQYTGEVALQVMSQEDVQEIAGPWALWPEGMTIEDMGALVTVSIQAGSSGKPDTTAQHQAWSAILPQLQAAIQQVGQLRGSSNEDIADCLQELVVETINRTGDHVDADRFLPDPPRNPPPPPAPPQPPMPDTALMGPQIQALTAVLADVRGGVLSADSAVALIHASAPSMPEDIVTRMVNGALPKAGDAPTQLNAPHAAPAPPPPAPAAPAAPIPEGATA